MFYSPTQLVPPQQKQGAGHLLDVVCTVGVEDVADLDQGPGTSDISNTSTSTTIITWNCSSDSWILPSCLRIKPEGEQMNVVNALTMSLSTIYPARSWRIHTSSEIPVAAS